MFFVMVCQKESPVDERSFSPSPFDSIHSSSAAEPQQLKMNVSTGRRLLHCFATYVGSFKSVQC